jgi:Tol biopolymer transport system component
VWGGRWSFDGKYYFFTAWDGDRSSLWAVSEADHWWKKLNESLPQQLTFGPMSIGSPAISKDGKQLYAVGTERRGELSAYDSKSGKFTPYLGGESICMVDFSRDGQWIAYVTYPEGTLWRSRIDGSERRQLTVPPLAVINPRWSPDGKLIVFGDVSNGDRSKMTYFGPRRVYAVSADGGGPVLLLAGYFGDPTWSPDGRSIAYDYLQYPASEVRFLDLQSQKSTTVPGSQRMWSPRWSPDGKYLGALGGDRPRFNAKLMLFSFASSTWEELASSGAGFGWPSWSHDSKFVYAQDGDSLVRIAIADHKKEEIASLEGFRTTSYYFDRIGFHWVGLTPDDRPLTTRDTGIQEIYAFDLEYK